MAKTGKLKIIYSKEAKLKLRKSKNSNKKQIPNNELLTYAMIGINAVIFILMELNGGSTNTLTLIKFGAVQRDFVFIVKDYYRLFTAMFLHIGLMHLMANSLHLYIFGTRVEHYFGKLSFLVIYILSGVAGSFAMILTSGSVSAGASGAIFGLTGATLALAQISKEPVDGLNLQSIVALVVLNLAVGFITPNVGNAAHIGGLAAGYALGFLLVKIKLRRSRSRFRI